MKEVTVHVEGSEYKFSDISEAIEHLCNDGRILAKVSFDISPSRIIMFVEEKFWYSLDKNGDELKVVRKITGDPIRCWSTPIVTSLE